MTPRRPTAASIDAAAIVPIGELNAERGRARYGDLCSGCHGLDGQGYRERREPLPYDYVPPVWGPRSYNDVAGLARVYTLAGFLRHAMPRDEPGTLDPRDAQEIAAFVNGQPRPSWPDKKAWDGTSPAGRRLRHRAVPEESLLRAARDRAVGHCPHSLIRWRKGRNQCFRTDSQLVATESCRVVGPRAVSACDVALISRALRYPPSRLPRASA